MVGEVCGVVAIRAWAVVGPVPATDAGAGVDLMSVVFPLWLEARAKAAPDPATARASTITTRMSPRLPAASAGGFVCSSDLLLKSIWK